MGKFCVTVNVKIARWVYVYLYILKQYQTLCHMLSVNFNINIDKTVSVVKKGVKFSVVK